MPRVDEVRTEVQRLIHSAPFHPFAMMMENGDRIVIEHPENIAFDPTENGSGSARFYVIAKQLTHFSTFGAVTSIAIVDQGEPTT